MLNPNSRSVGMGAVPGDLGWSRRMLWMHWVAAGTHSYAAAAGYSVQGTSRSRMGKELPAWSWHKPRGHSHYR